MQENNPIDPITQPIDNSASLIEQPKSNFLVILLSILLIISVAVAGFFAMQTQILVKELAELKTKEKVVAVATAEPTLETVATDSSKVDSTASWKTYIDTEKRFSFKYPTDWKVKANDDSKNLVSLVKKLPVGSVDEKYCNPNTDCISEVSMELRTTTKPAGYINVQGSLSPSSVFGEGFLPEKTEYLSVEDRKIRLEYLKDDSLYPAYSYLDLPSEILRIKTWLPSSKNCVGATCPVYTDSSEVVSASQEILDILSTFKFLN